jgi:hypothetical protein
MVFDAAGPAETVKHLGVGFTWDSTAELREYIRVFAQQWDDDTVTASAMIETLQQNAQRFKGERLLGQVADIVGARLAETGWSRVVQSRAENALAPEQHENEEIPFGRSEVALAQ